jgi:transposase-like protein
MTKIGGPGRIVCVDETHITHKKKSRSGFRGRTTKGHQTIVITGIELNGEWHERKETGRSFLVIIRDHTGETFRTVLEKHIHEGSIVWTDGHPSYLWLNSDERFVHETVIHRQREFARLREDGVNISTNAIEGVFQD